METGGRYTPPTSPAPRPVCSSRWAPSSPRQTPPQRNPPLPVTATIDRLAPGPPVPTEFLGLSFEAAALDQIAQYADRGNLVALLRSLGPGVLRFGGITADQNIGWTDTVTPKPPWASRAINPAQLQAIGRLSRRSGWKVLLTVPMAHFEPTAAAPRGGGGRPPSPRPVPGRRGDRQRARRLRQTHGFRELPWIAQG